MKMKRLQEISLLGTRLFIKNLYFKAFFNVPRETFILIYTNFCRIMNFILPSRVDTSRTNLKMIVPKSPLFIHIGYVSTMG